MLFHVPTYSIQSDRGVVTFRPKRNKHGREIETKTETRERDRSVYCHCFFEKGDF